MDKQLKKFTSDEIFFISAIQHEVFNRVFPKLRHDLVGNVSATLGRVSILDRILKKDGLDTDKIKTELAKIGQQLRNNIVDIRDLSFWDFATIQEDYLANILLKSVQLISSQLAFKGIELKVQPHEHENLDKVEVKPLLYTLLCLFSYLEDNNFENCLFNIILSANLITIKYERRVNAEFKLISNIRNLKITENDALQFAKLHCFDLVISDQHMTIKMQS